MASGTQHLTLAEFERVYGDRKPYYEFLFGEAVQKRAPTVLHGLMQKLLLLFFDRAGYRSAAEVELRTSAAWRPKPDVIASLLPLEQPYPTKPVDIVAEVLSHDDSFAGIFNRCQTLSQQGFAKIFVIDPESRRGWEWNADLDNLVRITDLELTNGSVIPVTALWQELDRQLGV